MNLENTFLYILPNFYLFHLFHNSTFYQVNRSKYHFSLFLRHANKILGKHNFACRAFANRVGYLLLDFRKRTVRSITSHCSYALQIKFCASTNFACRAFATKSHPAILQDGFLPIYMLCQYDFTLWLLSH